MSASLPPIERSAIVPWSPSEAFERFTARFDRWWPVSTHSIGAGRVKRIVFQCEVGGRIYEELRDGRRYQWGRVTAWDPPRRVAFTWHPSKDETTAQDVEVRFESAGNGCRVVLVSSGWEKLGVRAARERKGYSVGWGAILEVFAGRRSASMVLFATISRLMRFALWTSGRLEREIDSAGGRMPSSLS